MLLARYLIIAEKKEVKSDPVGELPPLDAVDVSTEASDNIDTSATDSTAPITE